MSSKRKYLKKMKSRSRTRSKSRQRKCKKTRKNNKYIMKGG